MLWLLVLALLGSTLELHFLAEGHGTGRLGSAAVAGSESGGEAFVCAEDHVPGAHFEPARAVDRHDCAACLHRLQVQGGGLASADLHGEGGPGAAAPVERPAAFRAPVLEHSPSRGPPAA